MELVNEMGIKLREIAFAARGSQGAGSRNLEFRFSNHK